MLAPTKAHSPLIFAAATFNFGESSISFADDFSDARANTFPAARGWIFPAEWFDQRRAALICGRRRKSKTDCSSLECLCLDWRMAAPIKTWRAPQRPAFLSRRARLLTNARTVKSWLARVVAIFRDNAAERIRPWATVAAHAIFHHLRITLSAWEKGDARRRFIRIGAHAEKLGFFMRRRFRLFRMLAAACSPENLISPTRFRSGAQLIYFSNCDRFWWKTAKLRWKLVANNFVVLAGKSFAIC